MDGTLVSIRVQDRTKIPNIYEYLDRNPTLKEVSTPEREL